MLPMQTISIRSNMGAAILLTETTKEAMSATDMIATPERMA
jgi:hypothetical protein